jgi:hypothetical protein
MTGPLAALATAAAHAHVTLDVAVLTIVIAAAMIRRARRHHRQRLIRRRIERIGSSDGAANSSKQP